eukprot:1208328-Pyramimonas_sp.AAC.1
MPRRSHEIPKPFSLQRNKRNPPLNGTSNHTEGEIASPKRLALRPHSLVYTTPTVFDASLRSPLSVTSFGHLIPSRGWSPSRLVPFPDERKSCSYRIPSIGIYRIRRPITARRYEPPRRGAESAWGVREGGVELQLEAAAHHGGAVPDGDTMAARGASQPGSGLRLGHPLPRALRTITTRIVRWGCGLKPTK